MSDGCVKKTARFKTLSAKIRSAADASHIQASQTSPTGGAAGDGIANNTLANNSQNNITINDDDDDGNSGGGQRRPAAESVGITRPDMPLSDIDPITKRPLENPCRNRVCGHVYGMTSVAEALQTNARMRCPIMGCANKRLVQLADLVPDKELARRLLAQRAQRNQ